MDEPSGTLGLRKIIEKSISHSNRFKEMPKKITDDVISVLIDEGLAFTADTDPYKAAKNIREADNKIVVLPLEHRITREKSNQIIKDVNPENYLYVDSIPVIKDALILSKDFAKLAGKEWSLPKDVDVDKVTRLTDKIAEMSGMYPYFQVKAAFGNRKGNPPIGFYWVGNDGRPRVVTWMRSIRGHEHFADYRTGEFLLELDKKFYGKTMKFTAPSQSNPKKSYDFWIKYLPIFSSGDRKQHSYWRKLSTTDNNPDAGYRGKAHEKRETECIFFTVYAISGYDSAAVRLRKDHELGKDKEIQVNPFPQLTGKGKVLLKILREQTIIGKRGLNVTEMDYLIGADTVNNNYDYNFVNWTR